MTERIEKRIVGGTLSELLYYLGLLQPGGVPVFEYDHDANPDLEGKLTTGFWCRYSIDSVKPGLKLEMIYRKVSIDGDGKSLASSPGVDYVSLCVEIVLVDDDEVVVSKKLGYPIFEEGFYPTGETEGAEQGGADQSATAVDSKTE